MICSDTEYEGVGSSVAKRPKVADVFRPETLDHAKPVDDLVATLTSSGIHVPPWAVGDMPTFDQAKLFTHKERTSFTDLMNSGKFEGVDERCTVFGMAQYSLPLPIFTRRISFQTTVGAWERFVCLL